MYVISYDISNNHIRNKVAKEMENYGRRVQYSVFECRISPKQLEILYHSLVELIQEDEYGNIRIYQLCGNCEQKIQILGVEETGLSRDEEELFII